MRMGTLKGKVKEIETQPELKPGSSECRLALLQVLGHTMYCGRFELKFIVRLNPTQLHHLALLSRAERHAGTSSTALLL